MILQVPYLVLLIFWTWTLLSLENEFRANFFEKKVLLRQAHSQNRDSKIKGKLESGSPKQVEIWWRDLEFSREQKHTLLTFKNDRKKWWVWLESMYRFSASIFWRHGVRCLSRVSGGPSVYIHLYDVYIHIHIHNYKKRIEKWIVRNRFLLVMKSWIRDAGKICSSTFLFWQDWYRIVINFMIIWCI